MKTLQQVEPRTPINLDNTPGDATSLFIITSPGSYYLTGNIKGFSGKHGIRIESSNVSIDLMGFQIAGVAGSLSGIYLSMANLEHITVINGFIVGWGDKGLFFTGSTTNCLIENVHASNNGTSGIRTGSMTVIKNCTSSKNQFGYNLGVACMIINSAMYQNTGWGMDANIGSIVLGCVAYDNATNGIVVGTGGSIIDCTAARNGLNGLQASSASTISRCTSFDNDGNGIWVSLDCFILNNTCNANGIGGDGAGIYVFGDGNRVEGNNCTDNQVGIEINGSTNYIIRNTCAGSAVNNYEISLDNRYGAIIDHTMTGTPSVFGNSASSFLGTVDPWANFAR